MAYTISLSTRFKKQYKKCMRQELSEAEFLKVVNILAETGTLPEQYRPHQATNHIIQLSINSLTLIINPAKLTDN